MKILSEENESILEIDKQHKKLDEHVNFLLDLNKLNTKQGEVDKAFDDLFVLADSHFKYEEALMKKYQFPNDIAHESDHNDLLQLLKGIKYLYIEKEGGIECNLDSILNGWISRHKDSEDEKLIKYLNL